MIDTTHPRLPEGLKEMGFEVDEGYNLSRDEILSRIDDYAGVIIRSRIPVDSEFIGAATNLKFIARVGAGMENIDISKAAENSTSLINAPEGNRGAVGEHAIGMLLMLFRNLKRADNEVRSGKWLREENRGYEIEGKTIGIIGYGHMGSSFAEKLKGFGARVVAYDPYISIEEEGVEQLNLEELKEVCDIVSLHVPLTSKTRCMVDLDFIDGMKKAFYLINTARGPVVKTADILKGLDSGKVAGACLDVLEFEKKSFENLFEDRNAILENLLERDNVILSPHIAGWTFESNLKMANTILEKVKALNLV